MNYPTDLGSIRFVVTPQTKRRFVKKCIVEGRSMTHVLTELLDEYLDRPTRERIGNDKFKYAIRRSESRCQ